MAVKVESLESSRCVWLQRSLTSAALELKYSRSVAAIELIDKTEQTRRLKVRNHSLQDEIDELHDRVWEERHKANEALNQFDNVTIQSEELRQELTRKALEITTRTRELDVLKIELNSMQHVSTDSSKILAEKLGLARDLAVLKPELEDLRDQVSSQQGLRAEKLALQRELETLKDELEHKNRRLSLAQAKQGKSSEKDTELEAQLSALERQLAKGKRECQKLQEDLYQAKKESGGGKTNSQKKSSPGQTEATDPENSTSREVEELQQSLAQEKRQREQAERQLQKTTSGLEAQKAVLEDKLNQFRTKLRTTKEKLKETETQLLEAQNIVTEKKPQVATHPLLQTKAKNPRKRTAVQIDPDAAIGTPGDTAPAKRAKHNATAVGGKSTFSITPFLKRTTSVARLSRIAAETSTVGDDAEAVSGEDALPSVEDDNVAVDSPSYHRSRKPTSPPKKQAPLAPASPGKSNPKVAKPKTSKLVLEAGHEDETETAPATTAGVVEPAVPISKAKTTTRPKLANISRLSLKPKTLTSFASYREGSAAPEMVTKKKRRLFGGNEGGPRTLFDEDEEDPSAQRSFGGAAGRGLGASLLAGAKGRAALISKKGLKRGPLVTASDGFTFSPLKRDRKAAALASEEVQA